MQTRFSTKELEEFSAYLNQEYGLKYLPEKFQQLENRIMPVMKEFDCRRLTDVILRFKHDIQLRMQVLNALTTNETWFFRHPSHHKILSKHILPKLIAKAKASGDNRIKIWSAGCSIGAELYSILITVLECLPDPEDWNLSFVGSDISSDAIERARSGKYSRHELRNTDIKILDKYFDRYGNDCYKIKPELYPLVEFEVLNLLERWPARKFDLIFCRNVMIYFDESHKRRITEKFLQALNPDGYYLTSANESIHWETEAGLKKLFIENEFVYQKTSRKKTFRIYHFATPSDLLRALNLLNQSGLPYELEKIKQINSGAPKRAIFIAQSDSNRAEELFSLSSIKISCHETFNK